MTFAVRHLQMRGFLEIVDELRAEFARQRAVVIAHVVAQVADRLAMRSRFGHGRVHAENGGRPSAARSGSSNAP